MKILLAVDESPVSSRAVETIISLAHQFKAETEVHLLHVRPPIPLDFATRHVSQADLDAYYRSAGEAVIQGPLARLDVAGLAVIPHLHVGQPADVILLLAEDLACDLVCLGRHGRAAVTDLLLGSVAARVARACVRPVLLVG